MKHVVGFSGGIDSQAAARWVLNRYAPEDVLLLNTEAGKNEHPLTVEHVRWYSENVHPVVVVTPLYRDMWETADMAESKGLDGNAELTFEGLIKHKGRAPSAMAQFCTENLKLRPQRRWLRENMGEQDYEMYSGVRRDESEGRKDAKFREWGDFFDTYLNNPIADWTKKMCFEYVTLHGEQFNPLYKLGFKRVGCAPCIHSKKDDLLLWSQRFPESIDKVRGIEQRTGVTFFAPTVPGMAINWVDDMVAWAHTSRGGRQFDAIKLHQERPACESKYGLCG
jgi:3'-phosphoadenosine 5'-phosphosulfate sulfotransferase (PAPS reductase)/FAD synthetase